MLINIDKINRKSVRNHTACSLQRRNRPNRHGKAGVTCFKYRIHHLSIESHHLSIESHHLSRESHHLSRESHHLSIKSHHLSIKSHHLSIKSRPDCKAGLTELFRHHTPHTWVPDDREDSTGALHYRSIIDLLIRDKIRSNGHSRQNL